MPVNLNQKRNYRYYNHKHLKNQVKRKMCEKSDMRVRFIVKCFYAVFFIFPSSSKTNSKIRNRLAVILNSFTILFLSYCLCVDIYNIRQIINKAPVPIIVSTVITDSASIIIRLILMIKRKDIIRMLCQVFKLEARLRSEKKSCYSLLKYPVYLFFASLTPALFITNVIDKSLKTGRRISYQKYTFFGWYTNDFWSSLISVLTVDILLQQQHYFMQGFCVILCCYLFTTISNIIRNFRRNLYARNHMSLKCFFRYFCKYYYKIYDCMEELENSMSLLLTLLYGFLVWNIFLVLTYLIRLKFGYKALLPFIVDVLSLIASCFTFLIISYRASSIHDSALLLQKTVFQRVALSATQDQHEGNLLIKMATDFVSKIVVTGSGLFTIKRNTVLKIVSVVVTYGIIITQFEQ